MNPTWEAWTGRASWHQRRAGHYLGAAVTTGFATEHDAKAYAERVKAHHPNEHTYVRRSPVQS